MWTQFLLENAHFAINIFAALVAFSVFWLHVDAWRERRTTRELLRAVGFFLLSGSFIFHAIYIETAIVVTSSLFNGVISEFIVACTRIVGYICILISLLMDPLERRPNQSRSSLANAIILPFGLIWVLDYAHIIYPILSVSIGFLYLRRATIGLERHLKPVAISFFLISIAEFFGLRELYLHSQTLRIFELVAPFHLFWLIEHGVLLLAVVSLGVWVFGYLFKQFATQLFIILTTIIIAIFLLTTVSFTGLLVRSVQDETLAQLDTNVHVLAYTLESKKAEVISDAQVVAQNIQVIGAVHDGTKMLLSDVSHDMLLTKKASSVIITNSTGQVLSRGEDRDRVNDSLSDNPLIKRAMRGETVASVVSKEGVVSPQLFVEAATPIKDQSTIIGVVLMGSAIDSAYVDGIKHETGLESTIYGDNRVSATTLRASDGVTRLHGIRMDQLSIKTTVLAHGEKYTGPVTLANTAYFGAFLPITDLDSNPVGMLFVGKPQLSVLQAAGKSIELTFIVTAVLIGLSVLPSFWISKYIVDQIN